MSYRRDRVSGTVGATGTLTIAPASAYIEVIGFRAVATGDVAGRIALVDGDSKSIFANAGDINYTTAKDTLIGADTTGTGTSGWTVVDSTGAALAIAGGQGIPAKGPISVNWTNGTAGDTLQLDLYYRYPLWVQHLDLTVPNPAADVEGTLTLRQRYAQIVGLSMLTVGTDALIKLKVEDADERVVFLDAADRDYDTARVNLLLGYDDTLTGLTPQHLDGTGVAATATSAAPLPVVRSPLTIGVLNGGTAGDTASIDVYYRV